jgi:energy-converting hydrogenase Eha subunit B
MVGGEHRVSRRIKLVTENYVFPDGGLVSGGVRFLGERLSVDLGLVSPVGAGGFVAVPMVNFVWKF